MMAKSETIVINDYEELTTKLRSRVTRSGAVKTRATIEFKSEPVVHEFNEINLGAGPAAALRDELEKQIKAITRPAKPSTIARRQRYLKDWRDGPSKSARKRYSGGRIGETPPTTSIRLFNDSGRLGEGLSVRQVPSESAWITNVVANRLGDGTDELIEQLVELVPLLRNPQSFTRGREFGAEIQESLDALVAKAKNVTAAKRKLLRRQKILLAKAVLKALT